MRRETVRRPRIARANARRSGEKIAAVYAHKMARVIVRSSAVTVKWPNVKVTGAPRCGREKEGMNGRVRLTVRLGFNDAPR